MRVLSLSGGPQLVGGVEKASWRSCILLMLHLRVGVSTLRRALSQTAGVGRGPVHSSKGGSKQRNRAPRPAPCQWLRMQLGFLPPLSPTLSVSSLTPSSSSLTSLGPPFRSPAEPQTLPCPSLHGVPWPSGKVQASLHLPMGGETRIKAFMVPGLPSSPASKRQRKVRPGPGGPAASSGWGRRNFLR